MENKEISLPLASFGKTVIVKVPADIDLQEAFNEASTFVETLVAHNRIRDKELGINPPRATHEIVRRTDGKYELNRFRFS